MSLTCEKCGTENPDNVKFCKQCGSKLVEETDVSTPTSSVSPPSVSPPLTKPAAPAWQPTASTSTIMEKRYGTLRSIAAFCRIIGYLSAGLMLISGIIGAVINLSDSIVVALGAFLGAVISALLFLVFWLIIAESISVILDIEENTRKTVVLLQEREGKL